MDGLSHLLQTVVYVTNTLQICGARSSQIFRDERVEIVHLWAGHVPRVRRIRSAPFMAPSILHTKSPKPARLPAGRHCQEFAKHSSLCTYALLVSPLGPERRRRRNPHFHQTWFSLSGSYIIIILQVRSFVLSYIVFVQLKEIGLLKSQYLKTYEIPCDWV